MTPDPSTADATVGEGGTGGQARDETPRRRPSRAGHLCICGQPIAAALWDMTLFASETTIAYLPCLWTTP